MASLTPFRPMAKSFQKLQVSCFFSYGRKLYTTKTSKPLRILFCGSDDFSIASLRALHAVHQRDPRLIKSIDVLCRPGKPTGRSLKKIREVPIKAVAQELGLPIHERDTFTGWELPKAENEPINLIVAVSFGLFVPPRILKGVEYGGLNVHPSLLPDFRGPAPLQRMIMKGVKQTGGVTLQTLDDKSFDHGLILAQHRYTIPDPATITYSKLLDIVKPKAAELLVKGLQDRVFVPPLLEQRRKDYTMPAKLTHALKITPEDKKILWRRQDTRRAVPLQYRALGRLWSTFYLDPRTTKRLIFEDIEKVEKPKSFSGMKPQPIHAADEGLHPLAIKRSYFQTKLEESSIYFVVPADDPKNIRPLFYLEDGDAVIFAVPYGGLRVERITVEGQEAKAASKVMQSFRQSPGMWRLKPKDSLGNSGKSESNPQEAEEGNDDAIYKAAGFF